MNYLNHKTQKIIAKAAKSLALLVALILICLFSFKTLSQNTLTLPNCENIEDTAKPGNNCLYYSITSNTPLPLCKNPWGSNDQNSAPYQIDQSNIISATVTAVHRVNCMDLSDLPLCNQIDNQNQIFPGKNCVRECIDLPTPTGGGTRGTDYAVHNRDCVRFCDVAEAGITLNQGVNCVQKRCHQDPSGQTSSSTCQLLNCNLLDPNELNETKFSDPSKRYCNGNSVKCFEFSKEQLPYLLVRASNSMCQLHKCRTAYSNSCSPHESDEVSTIIAKGVPYLEVYDNYILKVDRASITANNAANILINSPVCTANFCPPTLHIQYRCYDSTTNAISSDTSRATIRNPSCDTSGDGATCSGGYCFRTVDCSSSENSQRPECSTPTNPTSNLGTAQDTVRSWFYRPKPMDKSLVSGNVIDPQITKYPDTNTYSTDYSNNSLCYTTEQLSNHDGWGYFTAGDQWWHSMIHDSRSPGLCVNEGDKNGGRGWGYVYLCGNGGNLYSRAAGHTAFHKGYVRTEYSEQNGRHRLYVCLRFNNAMAPNRTCGSRECTITCSPGVRCIQQCGEDVCHELVINDSSTSECMMNSDNFNNDNSSKNCQKIIDDYLRIRAVKYGNRICTFLDLKGTLAYDGQYFNGTEKIYDTTNCAPGTTNSNSQCNIACISGTLNSTGGCVNAKNTNDDSGLAHKWRTVLRIPYIENNRPSSENLTGYLDIEGALFKAQDCIKVPYRIAPPRIYNLVSINNTPNLFTPPLFITNSSVKKGGIVSNPQEQGESYGPTDFYEPEVEVRFGDTLKKLSLNFGKNGDESAGSNDPNASATLSTTVNSFTYTTEIFVRKEYNSSISTPTFCLYRRVKDQNNNYINPQLVQCVKRNFPDINNGENSNSANLRKIEITAPTTNTYDNPSISFRYKVGGTAGTTLTLDNQNSNIANCNTDLERYKLCVQRDECTKLNIECIKNEIDLHNAQQAGESTSYFMNIRNSCQNIILPICNAKKAISSSTGSPDPKAYGWFNEICISQGFESKLRNIIAYKMESGVRGKCVIDVVRSPYMTDNDGSTNCDDGGKAPNCICVEYLPGASTLESNQVARLETTREAGLCIDIPLPQVCSAIDYTGATNSANPNDLYYASQSLNKTSYGDGENFVNNSHKRRSEGSGSGHAEFPESIFGMNNVEGACRGYWKNYINSVGQELKPQRNCNNNSGNAAWGPITNSCIRYSCPSIIAGVFDPSGFYNSGYGSNEIGDQKGLSNGFANWPSFNKTNDFPENVNATSCITGYKPYNSIRVPATGTITSYSGGNIPSRTCNQLGQWNNDISNKCVRITCPKINPPENPTNNSEWEQWYNSGGATFEETNASRSSSSTENTSIAQGTCKENLGFFQSPGAPKPTRECDSLGNWGPVINPCVTQCNKIDNLQQASSSNNGYSYWDEAIIPANETEVDGRNNGCVNDYVQYPYPALRDKYGNAYILGSTLDLNNRTIPNNVANDTRAPAMPQRVCTKSTANIWTATSSSCVNKCLGYNEDPRIGVGRTQHQTSHGTINIDWPSASFGDTIFYTNAGGFATNIPNLSQQDASNYENSNRNNGYFIVARKCNNDGTWKEVVPHCVTNNGIIGDSNIKYNSPQYSVEVNGKISDIDNSATSSFNASGICVTGYDPSGGTNPQPLLKYQCTYKNNNKNIDEVYYKEVSGQQCQKYCQITQNQIFSNSIYKGATGKYANNARIDLDCKPNYGSTVIGESQTNVFNDCGSSAAGLTSDRSSLRPYITCQADGNWGVVMNDCSPCRNCSYSSSSLSGTLTACTRLCRGIDYTECYTYNNSWFSSKYGSSNTLAHGSQITNTPYRSDYSKIWCTSCDGLCDYQMGFTGSYSDITLQCIDNKLKVLSIRAWANWK